MSVCLCNVRMWEGGEGRGQQVLLPVRLVIGAVELMMHWYPA